MRRLVALLRGLPVLALLGVVLVVPVHEARAGFTWLGDWQVTAVQNNSESRWSYGFTDWNPQTGSVYVGGYVYGSHYGLGGTTGQFTVTRSFELSGSDSFWVASLMLSGDAFWGGTSGYSHSANGGVRIDDLTIHTDYRGLSNGIHTFKMTLNVEVMNMRGQTWGGADAEAYITFSGHFTPAPEPSSFALLGVGLTAALWFRHRAARGGRERASSSGAA